jgi:hypothetical protein
MHVIFLLSRVGCEFVVSRCSTLLRDLPSRGYHAFADYARQLVRARASGWDLSEGENDYLHAPSIAQCTGRWVIGQPTNAGDGEERTGSCR